MFTPFRDNRSPLGLAALHAQDPAWQAPGDDEFLAGGEFAKRYLVPLSRSDLLVDGLHERTEVLAVGRDGPRKEDLPGDEARGDWMFRLLVRGAEGREETVLADIVIDTTGVYGNHRWIGEGGLTARGELALEKQIEHGLPDFTGTDRDRFANRHTLLVGTSHWAAENIVTLARLAEKSPQTRITWISGHRLDDDAGACDGPVLIITDDSAPERKTLIEEANRLALNAAGPVRYLRETTVDSIERTDVGWRISLLGEHAGQLDCDNIIGNVGYQPDYRFLEELQIARDAVKDAPVPLHPGGLLLHEPNFYVLGAKSFGRRDGFLVSDGLRQIRDLFRIIGDRDTLDLYATMGKLA
jgi:hypothetical protein